MHEVSPLLHFAEHRLQEAALLIMVVVYAFRIRWLLHFKAGGERQAPTGASDTTPRKGILYSWANIAMPWAMESTRTKRFLYAQFVVFHLGVTLAIGLSFIIPYLPVMLSFAPLVYLIQLLTATAFVIGCLRLARRIGNPYMRAISTPDDYFSLILLTVWFAFATLAAPNNLSGGEGIMLTYFFMTAFFLIYVPFSKISHYLYYPFTRYWFGKSMGYRGVYPIQRGPRPTPAGN
jgi:nitrate reductase gamma subunit